MFLPHYDVYRAFITEQTAAKCYLFVLYNQNLENFAKISFVVRRKGFSTPFDVIVSIQNKARHWLSIVLKLSLKWRQRASIL